MGKLKRNIKTIIKEAEKLNKTKLAAAVELEEAAATNSERLIQAVKVFIQVIKDNIDSRQKFVDELKDEETIKDSKAVLEITYEIDELSIKDDEAYDTCIAVLVEET